MFQPDTLVIVADGAGARFFAAEADLQELREIKKIQNHHHTGGHRKHGNDGHDGGHHAEESRFARQLGQEVDDALRGTDLDNIVLAAPPRMLGDVRDAIGGNAAKKIRATLARDLADEEVHKLAEHLRKLLANQHLEAAHH